jgi:hypothetical protein
MHRIVKAHLNSFAQSFGIESVDESIQFEMFTNFSVISSRASSQFELEDVTTGPADDGTDGIAIIIDEEVIASDEDAISVFKTDRKNHDVEIIFIQAKRSDFFELGDFLKFKESILRFINSDPYDIDDDVQKTAKAIFEVIIKKVPKIRGGKPSLTVRFVTTGTYQKPEALETAQIDFINQIEELGYFENLDIKFIGRDELTALWVNTYSGVSAQLNMFSNAPLPMISGINEAYIAVVKAKDFVQNLLITDEGNLQVQVFEENVRSFLGTDNPVNKSIAETLNSGDVATRFPVLNNGITIISQDVRLQGNTLHLENYQIVNGCQTSNVLFENRDLLNDSIMLNIKVIETTNEDIFSELVRATNSQSKIEETQFISLKPIVKKIECYFNTFEGQDGRLYFERRERQYVGKDIPVIRTFSVHLAAKSVTAMFLERPDLSFRYPKRMYSLFGEKIFGEDNKEIIFYTACLSLYRLHLLVSNGIIPQNMRRFKWHLLVLVRRIITGEPVPQLNSRKIELYCKKIIDAFSSHGDTVIKPFRKAVSIIEELGEITNDRLKRQAVLTEMIEKISEQSHAR